MANFNKPFDKVILSEGGWVNNPNDTGKETYLGISRVHHPNSKMWPIIDAVKKQFGTVGLTSRLKKLKELNDEARAIYKRDYWDKLKLDEVPSDKIAYQLFDHAVNAGTSASIKLAQEMVGLPITGRFSNELLTKLKEYGTQ